MELAGMSVAHSIYDLNKKHEKGSIKDVMVMVGPGSKPLFHEILNIFADNGGDGLVCARHLSDICFKVTTMQMR